MKEILQKWCETGRLSVEDAAMIISEYISMTNRSVNDMELQAILMAGQNIVPINWDLIIGKVASNYGLQYMLVHSAPDNSGNRKLLYRKLY